MRNKIHSLLDPVTNFGKVTVSTGYSSLDTTIVLSSGQGAKLPDPSVSGSFNLVWYNSTDYPDPSDDPNVEIVRCITRITDTIVIMRSQEGTIASNKNIPTKTYKLILSPTKKTITDIQSDAQSKVDTHASLLSTHGILGNIVGTTDIQTLTNKTISGNNNTISNINFGVSISQSSLTNQSFQNLIRNGDFQFWSAGLSAAPDNWAIYAGVTVARESINVLNGNYSLAMTFVSTQLPYSGIYTSVERFNINYYSGRTVTFVCWVRTLTPNQAKIILRDNVNQVQSAYHTGGGNWERLSVSTTVAPGADGIYPVLAMDTPGTAYFDGAMLVEGSIVPAFASHPFDLVLAEPRFKVGNFSRDISLASGTQTITGVGFKPSAVSFIMGMINVPTGSNGFMDSAGNQGNVEYKQGGLYQTSSAYCLIGRNPGLGDYSYGSFFSMNSDGYTVAWTKAGNPTGILDITYMAHR